MKDSRGTCVLVVDDSPVDRMMLSHVLQREGFSVLNASSGSAGVLLAREQQPDIILLDVVMPGENGFETCAWLKRDGRTSAIPVIFLSGSDDLQSRVAGLTIGGVDYIIKPFEREEVLARIRIHLRIRQAFEALIAHQQSQLSELQKAQRAILVRPEEMPLAKFAVHYRPLQEAGGDFYDVLPLADQIYGYFSADIGGHGLGAAFITSALKALILQNFTTLYTPAETMSLINGVLRPILSEGVVLSACCVRLNRRTRRLVFVSAGHPPLIHIHAGGTVDIVSAEGDLLGAFETPHFESHEIPVAEGDRFLLFSDGLIESAHGQAVTRAVGQQQLIDAAGQLRKLPLSEMVDRIAGSICSATEQANDDILLLGIEV